MQPAVYLARPYGTILNFMQQTGSRTLWVDYLRSFLTVLVVAHHSSLAYTTFASFDKVAYIRSTHPVVDSRRWVGLDIFENFNDIFFMSLMFLIAGLFVVKSIERKGTAAFIRDRFYWLFVPFIVGGTILNLIAHYPAYLLAHGTAPMVAYVTDFFLVEQWPVGPPWFIWVLFMFNIVFAAMNKLRSVSSPRTGIDGANGHTTAPAPTSAFSLVQERPQQSKPDSCRPGNTILLLLLLTFVLYVPFAFWLGPYKWTGYGPFDFQVSRIALYFGYFLLGTWLGYANFNDGLFSDSSKLVRNWPLWLAACGAVYTLLTISSPFLTSLVKNGTLTELQGYLIYYTIYVSSCTFSCIAFLTTFRALVKKANTLWDSLASHAYLIYLLHYPFVLWIQYLLLDAPVLVFIKFLVTFVVSVAGSWLLAIVLRKIRIIAKYL